MHTLSLFLILLATNPRQAFQILAPILGGSAAASCSSGTGAHVGGANGFDTNNTATVAVVYNATGGSGHVLTLWACGLSASQSISSVSDGGTSTFNIVDGAIQISDLTSCGSVYVKNVTAGSRTYTVTFSGSNTNKVLDIDELSGLDSTAPLDQHTTNPQAATSTTDGVTVGPVTTLNNGEYIWAGSGNRGTSNAINGGTGYTRDQAGVTAVVTEHRTSNLSCAGAVTATFTNATSQANASAIMTFH